MSVQFLNVSGIKTMYLVHEIPISITQLSIATQRKSPVSIEDTGLLKW